MKQPPLYSPFERFWHWTQAILILLLMLTGFEIHGSFSFFGYREAVRYHSSAAIAFLLLIALAIFWHFVTGEYRQYIPKRQFIREQFRYYISGIFRQEPHPTRKTRYNKFNPLQKLVYFSLKILVIPVIAGSGLLYMLYRYPHKNEIAILGTQTLRYIALVHTLGAFLLLAFLIAHLYLITTGETPLANLREMITGEPEKSTQPEERE